MCQQGEHHSGQGCCCGEDHGGCSCGCGCHSQTGYRFERRYQTKAEQIAELEAYLSDLKTEVQAVEEHLADLRR
jgi:hypothetical protein